MPPAPGRRTSAPCAPGSCCAARGAFAPFVPCGLLLFLLPAACTPGSTPPGVLDLTGIVESRASHNQGFGGVTMGVHHASDDAWWFEGSAGDAWIGGPPMDPADTFEIASVTKTFTATAILQLTEDDRLSLDDTLGDLLGARAQGLLVIDGHDHGPEITVRQLLHHDSGLPDYWTDPPFVRGTTNAFLRDFNADPDRVWSPDELIDHAADLRPIGVPGEHWHYSDTNYVLLGLILEALEHEPYDAVIRGRILVPLDLRDTWLSYHEQPTSDAVESHRFEGHDDLFRVPRQGADWAGGGLVSSQRDLATFLEALAGGRILRDPATLDAMLGLRPTGEDDITYGLGVFGIDLGAEGHLWGHDGYGGAFVYTWPEQDLTLVGTVNQTSTDWWPLVAEAIDATSRL